MTSATVMDRVFVLHIVHTTKRILVVYIFLSIFVLLKFYNTGLKRISETPYKFVILPTLVRLSPIRRIESSLQLSAAPGRLHYFKYVRITKE